jgi:multidrug efflux pump subunit AcrB
MRIWLRPTSSRSYNLTPSDVATAIREQNSQFAAGRFGEEPTPSAVDFTYSVTTQGRFSRSRGVREHHPAQPTNSAARAPQGRRARRAGRARLYASRDGFNGRRPCRSASSCSRAPTRSTCRGVKRRWTELPARFPEGCLRHPFDTTRFVEVSIEEVLKTFIEAIICSCCWSCSCSCRTGAPRSSRCWPCRCRSSARSPACTLLGFSINTLTLFGLVLAIGIVVDDAIVVLENVERIMRTEKLPPREATDQGDDRGHGPVIAIVLVLCAVFMPGVVPRRPRRRDVPAVRRHHRRLGRDLRHRRADADAGARRGLDWVTVRFTAIVSYFLRHTFQSLAIVAVMLGLTAFLFIRVPGGLLPDEDQGYNMLVMMLPPAARLSAPAMSPRPSSRVCARIRRSRTSFAMAGFDVLSFAQKTNAGVAFVTLKDWSERKEPAAGRPRHGARVRRAERHIPRRHHVRHQSAADSGHQHDRRLRALPARPLGRVARSAGASRQQGGAAAAKRPELAGVQTLFSTAVPQYRTTVDRDKAKALGIPINSIFDTMQSSFGSLYVNDFTLFGRTYRVSLSSEPDFRERPEDLRHVFVKSEKNVMVPLNELVTVTRIVGPDTVDRFNIFPAAKILGGPAPGYSSGQAIAAMQQVVAESLPDDYTIGWTGSAYQELATQGTGGLGFVFGLVMVFLILAAQYERWSLPLAVLTAVPFAVFGALLAVWVRGLENDVYFQIGLITLIGLAAKNAILIVEFASQRYQQGLSAYDAAMEAAKLRFRPIVMTSLAFILGVVPLAISSGAGSASRHSIGTGVIGGMLAATFIAILFVPLFFRLLTRRRKEEAKPAESAPVPPAH